MLGEMLELGDARDRAARECRACRGGGAGWTLLIAVGGEAAGALADAAVGGGHARASAFGTSPRATRAADAVAALVRPGDVVLVKGSRGVRTDQVVDRLKAEFA